LLYFSLRDILYILYNKFYYFIIALTASFFAQVFTATLENLNFFFLPFSSIVTKPILVTLSVKGQISITLEASIGFSNLTI